MKLVSRAQWGARKPKKGYTRLSTDLVTVHWEGPRMGVFNHDRCAGKVRGIQGYHMDTKQWNDVAYTAIVCPHGYVFEGRGPGARTGANGTNEGNSSAYAVCALLGQGDPVTEALLDGIADAVVWLRGRRVNAHRDWKSTECPGDELVGHVRAGRFTPSANPIPQPEEFTVDTEAEDRFKTLEAKVDRLLADAKSKTAWQGEIVKKLDALLERKV